MTNKNEAERCKLEADGKVIEQVIRELPSQAEKEHTLKGSAIYV